MLLSKHIDKGFWTLATNAVKALYGLLFTLWLIAVLPEQAWGTFYLVQVTFLIIIQLGLALAMQPFIKFYYEAADRLRLQSNAILIYAGFLAGALLLIVPFHRTISAFLHIDNPHTLLYFVPLLLFASFFKLLTNEIFRATHQLKAYFFSETLYFGCNVVLILAFHFQRGLSRPEDVLLPMSVSFFVSSLYGLWLARRNVVWGFALDFGLLKRMLHFGKYAFGAFTTSSIFQHADTYILGIYLNPAAVGLLGAVKVCGHGFQLYKQAMGLVAFPAFSRLNAEKRMADFRAFYEKGIYYSNVVLLTMMVGLIALAGVIFELVLQKYQQGAPLLRYFALTGLFVSWHVFGESVLYALGKPNLSFYTRIIAGIINVGLNIVLIQHFQIWGAVSASLLTFLALAGITTYYVHREIGFSFNGILQRRHDLYHFLQKNWKKKSAES